MRFLNISTKYIEEDFWYGLKGTLWKYIAVKKLFQFVWGWATKWANLTGLYTDRTFSFTYIIKFYT